MFNTQNFGKHRYNSSLVACIWDKDSIRMPAHSQLLTFPVYGCVWANPPSQKQILLLLPKRFHWKIHIALKKKLQKVLEKVFGWKICQVFPKNKWFEYQVEGQWWPIYFTINGRGWTERRKCRKFSNLWKIIQEKWKIHPVPWKSNENCNLPSTQWKSSRLQIVNSKKVKFLIVNCLYIMFVLFHYSHYPWI
jgi:hypothetical protein